MNKTYKQCSVIILAAGFSSRMGSPKFVMKFTKNKTFLDEIIQQYESFGCEKIVVVLNNEGFDYLKDKSVNFSNNVKLVKNRNPEWKRFYSIKLGLKTVSNEYPVFIHNVDNPFVNHEVLEKLFSSSSTDFVVPSYKNKGGHPILLSNHVVLEILSEKRNNIILSDFLKSFKKTYVTVNNKNILININSKNEYKKHFK